VIDSSRHVRGGTVAIALHTHIVDAILVHFHVFWRLELSWEENISHQAACNEAQNDNADNDTNESSDWNASNLIGVARVFSVQIGVGWLDVYGSFQSIIELVVWIVSSTMSTGITNTVSLIPSSINTMIIFIIVDTLVIFIIVLVRIMGIASVICTCNFTTSSNTISSDTFIWWNISSSENAFLLIEHTMLLLES
jgi:hypothetical protein